MALIDEYKQAIQDVLDGRAKEAPRPSELPWTEDKLASMWAAAAAELIAEANASGGGSSGGVLVVDMTYDEQSGNFIGNKTGGECYSAFTSGPVVLRFEEWCGSVVSASNIANAYTFTFYDPNSGTYYEATAESANANIEANMGE